MSDKSYPYIGEGKRSGNVVLFTAKGVGAVIAEGESVTDSFKVGVKSSTWEEGLFKNITRKYLANTYGKCDSQEHADFICGLAKVNKLKYRNDFGGDLLWFYCDGNKLEFYTENNAAGNNAKLIHLPLPPKESKMGSIQNSKIVAVVTPKENNSSNKPFNAIKIHKTNNGYVGRKECGMEFHVYDNFWEIEMLEAKPSKPIYTKEMHERGELPPVGSFVEKVTDKYSCDGKVFAETYDGCCIIYGWDKGSKLEVIAHTEISGVILPVVKYDDFVSSIIISEIKPITTIEDELVSFFGDTTDWPQERRVKVLLDKYNITPK